MDHNSSLNKGLSFVVLAFAQTMEKQVSQMKYESDTYKLNIIRAYWPVYQEIESLNASEPRDERYSIAAEKIIKSYKEMMREEDFENKEDE